MSWVVTVWAEVADETDAATLAANLKAACPDGALVDNQEHVPYVPEATDG